VFASTLILCSAFFHAFWNAVLKHEKGSPKILLLATSVSIIASLGYAVFADQLMWGSGRSIYFGIASGLFEGLYFLMLTQLFRSGNLGIQYATMRGGAMVLVWIVSLLIGREKITFDAGLGSLLILSGIFLTQAAGLKLRRKEFERSILSAVCIAGYHIMYDQALEGGIKPSALYAISLIVALPFLISVVWREKEKALKFTGRQILIASGVGTLMALSFILFLTGLLQTGPGYGIGLRNTSIVYALLFGYFLKERLTTTQLGGVCLIFLGAAILSLRNL